MIHVERIKQLGSRLKKDLTFLIFWRMVGLILSEHYILLKLSIHSGRWEPISDLETWAGVWITSLWVKLWWHKIVSKIHWSTIITLEAITALSSSKLTQMQSQTANNLQKIHKKVKKLKAVQLNKTKEKLKRKKRKIKLKSLVKIIHQAKRKLLFQRKLLSLLWILVLVYGKIVKINNDDYQKWNS